MMKETEEMRDARHALQELAASDPAAATNMLRHVAAYGALIAGRDGRAHCPGEPVFQAGFRLTHGSEKLYAAVTRRCHGESLFIAFDVDDAAGPPIGFGLFRLEGEHVVCYGRCVLWAPVNDGRALIVPVGDDEPAPNGYFAFRRGQPLRRVDGPLPGDFMAGVRRARARLAKLLAADGQPSGREGYVTLFRNEGQTVMVEVRRAA